MSLRILVADKDAHLSALMSQSLGNAGHVVTIASDAASVRSALGRGGNADVIFLDPELVGDRAGLVLERREKALIFLCSSRARDDRRVQEVSQALGNVEYLRKPFSILELETRLEGIVEEVAPVAPPPRTRSRLSAARSPVPVRKDRQRVRAAARATEGEELARKAGLLSRLRREWQDLQYANPREVLGLPAGVSMEIVDGTARRMMAQYSQLSRDEGSDAEARELASRLEGLVRESWKSFGRTEKKMQRAPEPVKEAPEASLSEEEQLLGLGRRLIKAESWEEADRALTKANQVNLADPAILAALGWARLHNPALDRDERIEEGVEYLLLAEQFGPKDLEVLVYLVQGLEIAGRLDAALIRVKRCKKLDPNDAEIRGLYRRIQAAVSAKEK